MLPCITKFDQENVTYALSIQHIFKTETMLTALDSVWSRFNKFRITVKTFHTFNFFNSYQIETTQKLVWKRKI